MGIEERKAREFQRREQDILTAALALVGEEHWDEVTIDQIAERAEIGKGTVYKHFKSKDEVCARIVVSHLQSLMDKLRALEGSLPYLPWVRAVLKTIWRHDLERPDLQKLHRYCERSQTALKLGPDMAQDFEAVRTEFRAYLASMVQDGIERGILSRQPVSYMLAAGWATSLGLIRLIGDGEEFPELTADERFLDYLAEFVVKGLMNASAAPDSDSPGIPGDPRS